MYICWCMWGTEEKELGRGNGKCKDHEPGQSGMFLGQKEGSVVCSIEILGETDRIPQRSRNQVTQVLISNGKDTVFILKMMGNQWRILIRESYILIYSVFCFVLEGGRSGNRWRLIGSLFQVRHLHLLYGGTWRWTVFVGKQNGMGCHSIF